LLRDPVKLLYGSQRSSVLQFIVTVRRHSIRQKNGGFWWFLV
jgi:hypothetical protein